MARKITKEQLIAEIDRTLDAIPGINPYSLNPFETMFSKVFHKLMARLWSKFLVKMPVCCAPKMEEVLRAISPVRGVVRAFVDRAGEVPQLQIK